MPSGCSDSTIPFLCLSNSVTAAGIRYGVMKIVFSLALDACFFLC